MCYTYICPVVRIVGDYSSTVSWIYFIPETSISLFAMQCDAMHYLGWKINDFQFEWFGAHMFRTEELLTSK